MNGSVVRRTQSLRRTTASISFSIVGHAIAGVLFWATFRDPALRPLWFIQFYVLLLFSTALTVYAIRLRRNLFRIIALLNVMVIHVVLAYPEGADLRLRAVLGTVFVAATMLEVDGAVAYVLAAVYALTLVLNQWPLTVWSHHIARPDLPSSLLLGSYLVFLSWLGGMVGSQEKRLRGQRTEIARLDKTVTALSDANLEFQEWGTRLQRATEEQERRRIAREVHDIVGHTLTNIQMMMEAGTDLVRKRPDALESLLLQSRDQAQRGLLETRRAMRNLRSVTAVQPQGMRRVFEVIRIFENATKLDVELNIGNAPQSFGGPIDDVVYRMVQEGLTNSIRHGNASRVSVSFWVIDAVVRITIKDDGAGSKSVVPGVGLSGMAERISQVGGTVRTESNRFGFSVLAEIPLGPEKGR